MLKHKLFNYIYFNNYVEEECGIAQIIILMQLKSPLLVLASSKRFQLPLLIGLLHDHPTAGAKVTSIIFQLGTTS